VPLQTNRFTAVSIKQLYEQHGAALAAYGCCCGLDFGSAEDVVQQIFLKLLERNAATVQTPLPYLYRSVRNTAMNYICETIRVAIPSPQRTNEERADLVAARESLLQALRSK
jgi:DNA-directed RNA polymerase specialized sigma24 family protein